MNVKAILPLAFALVLGLVAAFMAKSMLSKNRGSEAATGPLVPVVVFKADAQPGSLLTPDMVEVVHLDPKSVPEAHFTEIGQLAHRVVMNPTPKGLPVVESLLAVEGAGSGLQALIPDGMRAITVEVNEFSGVAGLLNVGSTVDVISTFQAGGVADTLTRTIVQNIRVTAVGQRIGGTPDNENGLARSVTLLVTPKDAEAIELATNIGRPRLVLRGGRDGKPSPAEGVTLAELKGKRADKNDPFEAPVVKPVELPTPATRPSEPEKTTTMHTIKVIKAGNESAVQFEVPIVKNRVYVGTHDEVR